MRHKGSTPPLKAVQSAKPGHARWRVGAGTVWRSASVPADCLRGTYRADRELLTGKRTVASSVAIEHLCHRHDSIPSAEVREKESADVNGRITLSP